jgi:hypothetical protein
MVTKSYPVYLGGTKVADRGARPGHVDSPGVAPRTPSRPFAPDEAA